MKFLPVLLLLLSIQISTAQIKPFELTVDQINHPEFQDQKEFTMNGNRFKIKKNKFGRGLLIWGPKEKKMDWLKHGRFHFYSSDGTLRSVSHFAFGLYHGKNTSFHDNGNANFITYYSKGKKEGVQHRYDRDGSLLDEYHFSQGKLHGWIHSYYNGKGSSKGPLHRLTQYVNGVIDGESTSFYRNGKASLKTNYNMGKQIGKRVHYDEKGNPRTY